MKIAFFIQSLEGGGAERVVCNLANYLVKRSHQVSIITMFNHGIAYEIDSKVSVVNTGISAQFYKSSPFKILRLIRTIQRMDVCVAFLSSPILTTLLLKPFFKARLICTERNYPPARYGVRLQQRLKRWANRADAWVFQTKQQREWYGTSVNNNRAFIIPNAINEVFLNVTEPKGERRKEIVTVGSLQEKKNHKLLIDAFAKITPKHPDYRLIIYGEGELKEMLEKQIKELQIESKVYFPGFVNDIPNTIKNTSMFVLSSNVEGIPNALIEAMALGLPCVSTRCDGGGAELLINDTVNGLLVPVNDVETLAGAMERILSDNELANKLGNNAVKLRETLAPEIIYEKWLNVIERI